MTLLIVAVAPATMPACPSLYSFAAHVTLGFTVDAIPVMVSAVITSSIICTKPSTSVASVEVAAVPVVSCDTTLCKLVTAASVTT